MKKTLIAILSILMILAFTGCKPKKDRLTKIKETGVITIATEATWEPWTYYDSNGNLTGFDVEVGRLIAEKLGVKAVFMETQWDAILAGVKSGRFDMACSGVSYTEERAKSYYFSDPHVFTDVVLIVRSDETRINSFEDLKGYKTANSVGSTYAGLGEKYGATVENVDTLDQTIELLISGRVDATINSLDSYNSYIEARPDAPIKVVETAPGDGVAFPFMLDDSSISLRDAVNKALEELRAEGKLAELSIKFFGTDNTVAR